MTLSIRPAAAVDLPLIARFIRDLAEYERLAHEVCFDEAVLDWNDPAIQFYKKLGAKPMDEWTTFRVDGDALEQLAEQRP